MIIENLIRKNILQLTPYSSARSEFEGEAVISLDANENPYPSGYNRYPDPLQKKLKNKIAQLRNLTPDQIFLGNGSDEAIDLLIRAFCEPYHDTIMIAEPTYGMYEVCAQINGVEVQRVSLTDNFNLDSEVLLRTVKPNTKIIFLCSPNNPTGNLLESEKIEQVLNNFNGLVVIDEAYFDFANTESFTQRLEKYNNLVILQTLSKAWGLAGIRLGICLASSLIISVLNKIKYPYNISTVTQQLALEKLEDPKMKELLVKEILKERETLFRELLLIKNVEHVFPSGANFLLVKIKDADSIYQKLLQKGIVVRNKSTSSGCENCLRITIGTPEENRMLIDTLRNYEEGTIY